MTGKMGGAGKYQTKRNGAMKGGDELVEAMEARLNGLCGPLHPGSDEGRRLTQKLGPNCLITR